MKPRRRIMKSHLRWVLLGQQVTDAGIDKFINHVIRECVTMGFAALHHGKASHRSTG